MCQVDWYPNQSIDIAGIAYGTFRTGTLASMYCNVYTSESTLTQTTQGYDVSIVVSFPQPLPNTLLPAWARGTTAEGVTGDWVPVGAHIVAYDELLAQEPPYGSGGGGSSGIGSSGDNPVAPPNLPSNTCGGDINFNSLLNQYSDGTLAATLTASTDPVGSGAAGWVNEVQNGHLTSRSGELANSGSATAMSMDTEIALLPFNSSPGNAGGIYAVIGDYYFSHPAPFCNVVLNYGFPAFTNESGGASIKGYVRSFDLSGAQVDPTPSIYSVTLNPPLVSGGTSTATITGINFGLAAGSLGLCYSGDDPCDGSDGADVSVTGITSWTTSSITATLNAAASAVGPYDVQVTSVGAGLGFQSNGTTTAQSNHGTFQVQTQMPAPCGDQRDTITQEYITYGVQLLPQCSWYTQTAHSAYYTFSQFNVHGSYAWALVKLPSTTSQSSGYGLDRWTQLIGSLQTINSAYRSPAHNAQIGGNPRSRHMFGDAVDLNNATHSLAEYTQKACAASVAAAKTYGGVTCASQPDASADYVEPTTLACHLNCVHADWRNHNRNQYSQ